MMRYLFWAFLVLITMSFQSNSYHLHGIVLDYETKEPLPELIISIKNKNTGSVEKIEITDSLGYFDLLLEKPEANFLLFKYPFSFDTEIFFGKNSFRLGDLDTVYVVRKKIKLPKNTNCAAEYITLKKSYRIKEIKTAKYQMNFLNGSLRFDTTYQKDIRTITRVEKFERFHIDL